MKIIFITDFSQALEVERLLVKKLKYKWHHARRGGLFLKQHLGKQGIPKGMYFVLWDDKILTWGLGDKVKNLKESVDKITVEEFLAENK